MYSNITPERIEKLASITDDYDIWDMITSMCVSNPNISDEKVFEWIDNDDENLKWCGVSACKGRYLSLATIKDFLSNRSDYYSREAAWNLLESYCDIPIETIEEWIHSDSILVREAAFDILLADHTEVPFYVLETGLRDDNFIVRGAAIKACHRIIESLESQILQYNLNNDSEESI